MVRSILDKAYQEATQILTANLDKLHEMAKALLLYETIDMPQIDAIMEGREPDPPKGWESDASKRGKGGGASRGGGSESPIGGPATQSSTQHDAG